MKQEQQLARHMLVHREKGYSVGYVIRQSMWRYLILLVFAAGMLLACFAAEDRVRQLICVWGVGMFAGAIVRDVGWIRRLRRNWPFTQKITDWTRVEAIARGEDRQATKTRNDLPDASAP